MSAALRLILEAVAVGCYAASLVLAGSDAPASAPVTRKVTRKQPRQDRDTLPSLLSFEDQEREQESAPATPPARSYARAREEPESGVHLKACSPSEEVDDVHEVLRPVPDEARGLLGRSRPPGHIEGDAPSDGGLVQRAVREREGLLGSLERVHGHEPDHATVHIEPSERPAPTSARGELPLTFGDEQAAIADKARDESSQPRLRNPLSCWGKFVVWCADNQKRRTRSGWRAWAERERERMEQLELPQARAPDTPRAPPRLALDHFCPAHGRNRCRCDGLARARPKTPETLIANGE